MLHLFKFTRTILSIKHPEPRLLRFSSTGPMKPEDQWKKWIGKVTGNQKDIQQALETLKREPKDAEELAELILEQRRKEFHEFCCRVASNC